MTDRAIYLQVQLAYDEEADIWFIAESDVPGLHLEAETAEELARKVDAAAPEMVELNLAEILRRHGSSGGQMPAFMLRHTYDTPLRIAR